MRLTIIGPALGLNTPVRPKQAPLTWSAFAPLVCALHCAAAPLLVVAAPGFARIARLEWPLMGVALVLGGWALARGNGAHRGRGAGSAFVLGIALWSASLLGWLEPLPEGATTVAGSLIAAAALFWNARLVHQSSCRTCGCPACEEVPQSC
jgi:hypothetical protein